MFALESNFWPCASYCSLTARVLARRASVPSTLKCRVSAFASVQPARRRREGMSGIRREAPTTRMGRALARLAGAPFGWSPERPSPGGRRSTYPRTTSRLRLSVASDGGVEVRGQPHLQAGWRRPYDPQNYEAVGAALVGGPWPPHAPSSVIQQGRQGAHVPGSVSVATTKFTQRSVAHPSPPVAGGGCSGRLK